MRTLAVAGGASPSLGRAIASAVFARHPPDRWRLLILSRSPRSPPWLRALDPHAHRHALRAVDYTSIPSLTSALRGVHTLVSVTGAVDGTQAQTQINLLRAAVNAACKRYAPSQFGLGHKAWTEIPSLRWLNQDLFGQCAKHSSNIDIAYFNHGCFMNYLGHGVFPASKPASEEEDALRTMQQGQVYKAGEDSACEGLQRCGPLSDRSGGYLIGLKSGIAELPVRSDGRWPRITLTTVGDVGRFVAASLDLPAWRGRMDMVGETVTMGQLLRHAEQVTGKTFRVTALQADAIRRKMATFSWDDFSGLLWSELDLAYTRDKDDEAVLQPVLNNHFPDIRPVTVHKYLEKAWNQVM